MIVRPELRALRGDDAPQRMAQTAIGAVFEQWRCGPIGCLIEAELGRFCEGQLLEDLPLLATLFAPGEPGVAEFLDGLMRPLLLQLAREPLSQSPLRYSSDDGLSSIVLARCGTTVLSLQVLDGI